jgi:hypothetical protein
MKIFISSSVRSPKSGRTVAEPDDTLVGDALPPFEELVVQLAAVVGQARAKDERLSNDLVVRFGMV